MTSEEFLKKIGSDEWVETRTLNVSSSTWVPQGELIIMSGRPLSFPKETRDKEN